MGLSSNPMDFVVMGRQQGKTTKILEWLVASPTDECRVGIFLTETEAMDLLRKSRAEGMGLESWQFVSLGAVLHRGPGFMAGVRRRSVPIVYAIDNLDLVLPYLFHDLPIVMATATGTVVQ